MFNITLNQYFKKPHINKAEWKLKSTLYDSYVLMIQGEHSPASERTEGEREGCSVGEMVNKANGCNKLEFLGRKILIELVLVERTQSMQW